MSSLWWIFASLVYALCVMTLGWQCRQAQKPFVHGFIWIVFLFVFQSIALLLKGLEIEACPVRGEANVLFYFSWGLTLFYIILGRPYRASALGLFTLPGVCLLTIASLGLTFTSTETPYVDNLLLTIHVAIAMLGYAALILSGVLGLIFLAENKKLKKHLLPSKENGLPPIRILHKSMKRLMLVSFILIIISEIFGVVAHLDVPTIKLWIVGILNGAFAVIWFWQIVWGLSGKKWAISSVILALFSLSIFLVNK